ncbi:Crp/Fnr family transcriptional regulator [Neolewinella antarctica]|uniref:CRP-like cAMP-binding protein n=1 Tax=Neolewinella antarctica TaxID=442734 RepID=A0ABX0X8M2_9BACT|nr:Crp/Fnr family transcriptional regulator [Neolewinella antarctica]NJC25614.1 CRP-like cAMP-binding protein [Neolewinella antarctica]
MNLEEKIRAQISKIPFLNKEEIETIVEKTIVRAFNEGTVLLRQGQIPTKCYLVVEGCVREYLTADGEEKTTAFFTQGESFTPFAKDGKPSEYTWECAVDCVLTVSNEEYEQEIRAALPRLDAVFQQMAIGKINEAKEALTRFANSSPEERYLNLLETKPGLLGVVPQHQIASYLGIKPQSLSRIRKRLMSKQD